MEPPTAQYHRIQPSLTLIPTFQAVSANNCTLTEAIDCPAKSASTPSGTIDLISGSRHSINRCEDAITKSARLPADGPMTA